MIARHFVYRIFVRLLNIIYEIDNLIQHAIHETYCDHFNSIGALSWGR